MSVKVLPYQLKNQINEIKSDLFYPEINSLKGNILEIGIGNGDNYKYFNFAQSKIYAIEKNEKHLQSAMNNTLDYDIVVKKGVAEKIPFNDNFFDNVVFSFVLCSVDSIEKGFMEILRVLKKGGKVVFLEHIKSNSKMTLAVQKIITGIQSFFIDCHLDRDPRLFVDETKYKIESEKLFMNNLEPYLFMELIKI